MAATEPVAPTLARPLSDGEREEFRRLFEARLASVKLKTAEVFALRDVRRPPVIVNSALYWAFGLDPETFPDEYYDDPAVMTAFQERTCYEQVRDIEDDFVPYLMPWFGTVVVASAFGCPVEIYPKRDPATNPRHFPVRTPDDIRRLRIPDPEKDGLMPRVLQVIRYMKEHSFLPVGITDLQGPLTTANQLMGYDHLIYLMHDDPAAMHELMDKVTETLIIWAKKQKEIIGEPLTECISDQQVYTGKHAGIWFSDDDCVLMSPAAYREFVVPYNSRLLQAFGGGCLHYCGAGTHQADNFLATEGLLAINNYTLHNTGAFRRLVAKLEDRIVVFACDFTPLEYESYFHELLDGLSCRGLVVQTQFSPVIALLKGGKYEALRRDLVPTRRAVHSFLGNYFDQQSALRGR